MSANTFEMKLNKDGRILLRKLLHFGTKLEHGKIRKYGQKIAA